jgi:predicted house-cleaning NTP pyrophosphatase (Maf/HAM1 superfamily)
VIDGEVSTIVGLPKEALTQDLEALHLLD